jgi:hypothetical protein
VVIWSYIPTEYRSPPPKPSTVKGEGYNEISEVIGQTSKPDLLRYVSIESMRDKKAAIRVAWPITRRHV